LIDSDPSPYTLPLLILTTLHQSCNSSGGGTTVADADWDASSHARVNSSYKHQNKIGNTLEKYKKNTLVLDKLTYHIYMTYIHMC